MTKLKLIGSALALSLSGAAFAAGASCCADMACCKEGADCCKEQKGNKVDCCDKKDGGKPNHAKHDMSGMKH